MHTGELIKLLLKGPFAVMVFLFGNIMLHPFESGGSYRVNSIPFLPGKFIFHHALAIDPVRAAAFNMFNDFRNGFKRILLKKAMYMVRHAIDNPDLAAGFLEFAAQVKMDGFLNSRTQIGGFVFGGPDRMDPDPG